jgi:hypothetical protein
MAFNFRLGSGLVLINSYRYEFSQGSSEHFASLYVSADAGFSFQWFVWRSLYTELGLEYLHIFTPADETHPGTARPFMGMGWRF